MYSCSTEVLQQMFAQSLVSFLKSSNCYKVVSVEELSFDLESFHGKNDLAFSDVHNNGDNFKYEEYILAESLARQGLISSNYRHGNGNKVCKECDIVDEDRRLQIEVVTELKGDKLSKNKKAFSDAIFLGSEARNAKKISEALKAKFDEKDYTEKYKKGICILSFGDKYSTAIMAALVRKNLFKHPGVCSKNFFEEVYLYFYDIVQEEYFFLHVNQEKEKPKPMSVSDIPVFINKRACDVSDLDPRKWYQVKLENESGVVEEIIENGCRIKKLLEKSSA